jgi:hypothetical protein
MNYYIHLAVNRSLQPVQKLPFEFTECSCMPLAGRVSHRRCCMKRALTSRTNIMPSHALPGELRLSRSAALPLRGSPTSSGSDGQPSARIVYCQLGDRFLRHALLTESGQESIR